MKDGRGERITERVTKRERIRKMGGISDLNLMRKKEKREALVMELKSVAKWSFKPQPRLSNDESKNCR
ncbi:conserved hypothetical protein [Ricinus communis]|uniref:Uncharacterized protein n=1 Tax=Ricinus communis TaxID=3988 RepID=B9SBP6_RICCO|nr:conserved hypothetical protein [Ricinus communis]